MNLNTLTLTQASRLLRSRQVSPLELTQAYLERIERLNPGLNCYLTVTGEQALEQATAAERAMQGGEYRGPLHGIPIGLKDLFDTAGTLTTAGAKLFAQRVPEQDAAVVIRLRQAGAVLLGKHNLHEIALGVTTENPHFGDCCNPWDPARSPGGSSGGSAAALAAGLCLGALGTDTGGSIRIPSSLCGTVGLKPTFGRVSRRGLLPLSETLDHAGPMARQVKDVALLLNAIAGYDPQDPYSRPQAEEDFLTQLEAGVAGWRIALAGGEYFERAEPEIVAAVRVAATQFEQLGGQVERLELPAARQAGRANGLITTTEAATRYQEALLMQPEIFGADVLQRLRQGQATSAADYGRARQEQVALRQQFVELFQRYDLLLTPTTAIAAPLRGSEDAVRRARELLRDTSPFNLTGLPALSLPCGFTTEGLPIGLQIVAPHWAEARLLRAAYAYEQNTPWHQRWPEMLLE
ncbi:MAG: Asp-tRNA(Asn)/Glu-tRNA(Gln) amidotransferase subunit GatA [Anaerolineales bacterium]|nr:Asp-tRNA(Asn)/Glu-tRNA(Gln) amidotransferase subunit GatA [Anaerolineales bacterium]